MPNDMRQTLEKIVLVVTLLGGGAAMASDTPPNIDGFLFRPSEMTKWQSEGLIPFVFALSGDTVWACPLKPLGDPEEGASLCRAPRVQVYVNGRWVDCPRKAMEHDRLQLLMPNLQGGQVICFETKSVREFIVGFLALHGNYPSRDAHHSMTVRIGVKLYYVDRNVNEMKFAGWAFTDIVRCGVKADGAVEFALWDGTETERDNILKSESSWLSDRPGAW